MRHVENRHGGTRPRLGTRAAYRKRSKQGWNTSNVMAKRTFAAGRGGAVRSWARVRDRRERIGGSALGDVGGTSGLGDGHAGAAWTDSGRVRNGLDERREVVEAGGARVKGGESGQRPIRRDHGAAKA